jgi:hypothetical protein
MKHQSGREIQPIFVHLALGRRLKSVETDLALWQRTPMLLTFPNERSRTGLLSKNRIARNGPVVYQFKITLVDSWPRIWRRILVADGTLDDLHEHIQTAMGWTNSHLHEFQIGGRQYGDPELLDEYFDSDPVINSRETQLRKLFGGKRPPRTFQYVYDFGDDWNHEIEFEGTCPAEVATEYPICVDGGWACPPEDVGGTAAYNEFLEAIRDPEHEEHEAAIESLGRQYDAEFFSARETTKTMRKGLPDWHNCC